MSSTASRDATVAIPNARLRPPSRLVEFKTDAVYAVRRDANGAGVRLRQLQDQEHRAGYAKGSERRHGDGRVTGFRVQPGQKKRNAGPYGNEIEGRPRDRVYGLQRHQDAILPDGGVIALGVREQRF